MQLSSIFFVTIYLIITIVLIVKANRIEKQKNKNFHKLCDLERQVSNSEKNILQLRNEFNSHESRVIKQDAELIETTINHLFKL